MAWSLKGTLRGPQGPAGPRGTSCIAVGSNRPASAQAGDVWVETGADGMPASLRAYNDGAGTSPGPSTYPGTGTAPSGAGWDNAIMTRE